MPAAIMMPGIIPSGVDISAPTALMDMFPDAAGADRRTAAQGQSGGWAQSLASAERGTLEQISSQIPVFTTVASSCLQPALIPESG